MDRKQIEMWFTHPTTSAAANTELTKLHDQGRAFALALFDSLPDNRERTLALTRLEETVMWANTAITRAPRTHTT